MDTPDPRYVRAFCRQNVNVSRVPQLRKDAMTGVPGITSSCLRDGAFAAASQVADEFEVRTFGGHRMSGNLSASIQRNPRLVAHCAAAFFASEQP